MLDELTEKSEVGSFDRPLSPSRVESIGTKRNTVCMYFYSNYCAIGFHVGEGLSWDASTLISILHAPGWLMCPIIQGRLLQASRSHRKIANW